MIRSCCVLVAVLQVLGASAQSDSSGPPRDPSQHPFLSKIPRQCWAPPPGIDIYKCCPIPRLYPDEVMEKCGIKRAGAEEPEKKLPVSKVPCKEGICLMKNANLLKQNNSIDYIKLRGFLEHWANTNFEFTDAILAAKKVCAQDGGPPGPPDGPCEHDRIFFCLTSNIVWNCKLRELEGCDILKEHMDECRQYYVKPEEKK
uniref:Odorant binding protein n=1 Tax=Heliothis virescens TaxID=7102 RepID=A0A2A4IX59_HELVI